MKFDPISKNLYTDAGEFIKKLHCPLARRWEQLDARTGSPHRHCRECERTVLDTAQFNDHELLAAVGANPRACLAIDAKQPNVNIFCEGSTLHVAGGGPVNIANNRAAAPVARREGSHRNCNLAPSPATGAVALQIPEG